MTIPDYYRPRDLYPLNGLFAGVDRRLIQPRHHVDPPYALELQVWEAGMKHASILWQPMSKAEPLQFNWPRIDAINLCNRGYLPIRIRDVYSLYGDVATLNPAYLKDGLLPPNAQHKVQVQWRNPGEYVAWVALRLQKPFDDIMIEIGRRI